MGYTNETPNFKLPQYLAEDKPSYLGDWNETMGVLDTSLQANKSDITDVDTKVVNLTTRVNNSETAFTELATHVVLQDNKIDEAQTDITSLENANTTINSRLGANETNISNINKFFTITSSYLQPNSSMSITGGNITGGDGLYVALNDEKSYGKIYGGLAITATGGLITLNTNIKIKSPSAPFIIDGLVSSFMFPNLGFYGIHALNVDITGNITITISNLNSGDRVFLWSVPCFIVFRNFGDGIIDPASLNITNTQLLESDDFKAAVNELISENSIIRKMNNA